MRSQGARGIHRGRSGRGGSTLRAESGGMGGARWFCPRYLLAMVLGPLDSYFKAGHKLWKNDIKSLSIELKHGKVGGKFVDQTF